MGNHYYRFPVTLGDRLRGVIGNIERAQQGEPDYRLIERQHRARLHRQRLLNFKAVIEAEESRRVRKTDTPCECERNHHAIALNGHMFCPLLFWLNMCQLVRMKDGDRAMSAWSQEHPLERYISRISGDLDATYRAELDLAAREEDNESKSASR